MLKDAIDSLNDIASPPFRKVVVKSLALTAAALLVAWFGLDRLALHFVTLQPPWLATLIAWLIGLGLLVGAVFLAAPVASLVASLFFDEIAAHVEAEIDPFGPPGRAAPFVEATLAALRFFGLSLAVGIVSLILLFVPASASSPGSPPTPICSGANISSWRRCASIPPRRRARCAAGTPRSSSSTA